MINDNEKTSLPQKEDRGGRFKNKILNCLPCFAITALECAVITGLVYSIIAIFKYINATAGLIVLSVLCLICMAGWSLICWKKRKDKKDGYIEKEG